MFHFSEQWSIKSEREALINPASKFIGETKLFKKTSFKELHEKGVKTRRTRWCRGADNIENYSNKMEDTTGKKSYKAYHYFDSEYKMWCTEYYELTYP
tara:strand:- start:76 stop:369 length:294 start_codon:yes stop_codon:yes gene_type:complete